MHKERFCNVLIIILVLIAISLVFYSCNVFKAYQYLANEQGLVGITICGKVETISEKNNCFYLDINVGNGKLQHCSVTPDQFNERGPISIGSLIWVYVERDVRDRFDPSTEVFSSYGIRIL